MTNIAMAVSGEEEEQIRHDLGFDRPLWQRYLDWIGGVIRFDLGRAYLGGSVTEEVMAVLPWSLTVFGLALGAGFALGQAIGRRVGMADRPVSPILIAGAALTSLFPPWLALLMVKLVTDVAGFGWWDRMRNLDEKLWDLPPTPMSYGLRSRP
jgi:peptide/nickel transport system permease protein